MEPVLQLLRSGILEWDAWRILAYTLVTTHLTIVAVTIYLHRCQAHRALDLHPALAHALRFWLWLTTGMVTREWVAIHRKHHACCERQGDPHSPQLFGIRKVLLQGAELYREAGNAQTLERYGAGTPDDWIERHLYSRFVWQGVGLLLVADLLMFGVIGLSVWGVQMLWIPVCAAGIINGIGHYAGYRNFDGPHAAANIVPLGIIIGGEELHNNHHTFPTSARLAVRWFEIDIGWCYIRLFEALGLARVRAVAPRPRRGGRECALSEATLAAICTHRHHLMRRLGILLARAMRKQLLRDPAGRHGAHARRQLERLLRREPAYLSDSEKQALASWHERLAWLAQAQRMREELTQLWERSLASPQELVARLVDWCDRAERSGIQTLRTFARELRTYGAASA
jgi:stearoyl-CoA desaturase (delta-9 desaturase)